MPSTALKTILSNEHRNCRHFDRNKLFNLNSLWSLRGMYFSFSLSAWFVENSHREQHHIFAWNSVSRAVGIILLLEIPPHHSPRCKRWIREKSEVHIFGINDPTGSPTGKKSALPINEKVRHPLLRDSDCRLGKRKKTHTDTHVSPKGSFSVRLVKESKIRLH